MNMYESLPKMYDIWCHAKDLAFLASDAAIDLDNAFAGRGKAIYSSVKKLAKILSNEAQVNKAKPKNMSPYTSAAFYDALIDSGQAMGIVPERIARMEGLVGCIEVIAEELQRAETLPKKRLQALAGFCCALSKKTIKYNPYEPRSQLVA